MLKDITLGKYYSGDSLIHRLDPRFKIRFFLIYTILALLDRSLWLFSMLSIALVVMYVMSRVPLKYAVRGTGGIFLVVAVCSFINAFTTAGSVILRIGVIELTHEGLVKSLYVLWRMLMIIFAASLVMYTTMPMRLADGIEKCFHLKGSTAVGISIALRFVSVLSDELNKILIAQEARGVGIEGKGVVASIKRIKLILPLLFQCAINRAGMLGEAMDARCYGAEGRRTRIDPLEYTFEDYLAYALLLGMLVLGVVLIIKC